MNRGVFMGTWWRGVVFSLILCFALIPFVALPTAAADTVQGCDVCLSYPIMHPDRETLERWIEDYNNAPRAYIDKEGVQVSSPGGSLDLLDHLEYTPSQRNQGSCGDCWAWAGTGVMEIALDVQEGIKDRLSVQYINSCGEVIGKGCCNVGWLSDLADFYDYTDMAIPWSNTNAEWQGSGTCGMDCGSISTDPNYPVTSIQAQVVPTQPPNGVTDQATAIANIKYVLNQNKAVWFCFFLPTSDAWNNFDNFWLYSNERVVCNIDQFCGVPDEGAGGHAVLCVGYNDTDPNNSYWVMLNSWGTTIGRPNGLFRINMDMNYQCMNSFYSFYWQTLDITFIPIPLGEALDNTALNWTTGGNANWFGQTGTYCYGGGAAQSGAISDSQSTWLKTTVAGPGTVGFYWKVSSESNFDFLRFYIDGVEQTQISGSVDWQHPIYTISSGTHTVEWRYTKDGSASIGSDCGWVDKVELATMTVVSPNGGEAWAAGSSQTIRWTYTLNPGAYVKIELFKGGVLNRTISSSMSIGTGGNGSYNWAIPSTQVSGTDYRIKITSTTNAAYTDTSNADFTIIGPPPSAPTLKSPASASTVSSLTPRLEWNASSGAVSYGVQVSTSSSFTTLLVNETGITNLYYDIAPAILNWSTTYYWRVNAKDSFGSTSTWSSYWYFKTALGPPPNAPSNLVATPVSSSQINLTWQDNSGDETGFKIERKTGSGSCSQIATVGAGVSSYSNTGLTASTTYYYRVRAYNAVGNSDYSNEASATTLPPPPSAPTLKSPASASTVSSLTPRLEWNAATGAADYGLQVATTSSFTTLLVNETGIANLYYDIASGTLKWNTTYYWRVNARNSYGSTSSWSTSRYFKTAVGPPPNAPSNLIATPISSSQINLTWQDNSSDETGFKIERKTGTGSYSQIATVGANVTSYSNSGLSANTTYYYRVRAYNAAGNSDYSSEASATTLPPPPSAPTLKSPASASTVPSLTPRLEWNASSGPVSYGIQISTSSSFATSLVNETGIANLYYDIAPGILKWNTTYYWRVNARNSFGSTSSWSTSRYFKTAVGPPPNAPTDLIATPISSSQINLTWQDNSSDESGFKIERKTGTGSYSQIATVGANVTSYSNSGLSASTTYYYRVRAYNAAGNSNYSNEASATTLPPPPSAPTLKSPASASTVPSLTPRLEWNASSGAVSYGIQISTSSRFISLTVNETGITDLFYDVLEGTLNWNTTYYWRVNARNSYGSTSSWSTSRYFKTAVGPPPNAPSDLIATPISSSQINLTWQDNSSDESGFKIEKKTGSGSYSQIATVGAGVTSYSNTLLSANTTYYYRVRAYKGTLNSDYCEEASATTLPPPPPAPTLKSPASASTVSNLTPRLEWNASSGAVSYGVQVSTSSSFASLVVNETGITNLYYDIALGILKWSTTYYWRVNARNSFGSTSSWSSYRYFRTPAGS